MTTKLQAEMIVKIAENEHTNVNGAIPKQHHDIGWIWASEIIVTAQDKGTFTSLRNVGLVRQNGLSGEDSCVSLTVQGFQEYQAIKQTTNV